MNVAGATTAAMLLLSVKDKVLAEWEDGGVHAGRWGRAIPWLSLAWW